MNCEPCEPILCIVCNINRVEEKGGTCDPCLPEEPVIEDPPTPEPVIKEKVKETWI